LVLENTLLWNTPSWRRICCGGRSYAFTLDRLEKASPVFCPDHEGAFFPPALEPLVAGSLNSRSNFFYPPPNFSDSGQASLPSMAGLLNRAEYTIAPSRSPFFLLSRMASGPFSSPKSEDQASKKKFNPSLSICVPSSGSPCLLFPSAAAETAFSPGFYMVYPNPVIFVRLISQLCSSALWPFPFETESRLREYLPKCFVYSDSSRFLSTTSSALTGLDNRGHRDILPPPLRPFSSRDLVPALKD